MVDKYVDLQSTPKPKKHICVIGAGASGLVVMKELTELGHSVECFEQLPVVGGAYVKAYPGAILTTSSLLTAFSFYSDGKEDQPKFWTAEEYMVYLSGFANKFDLYQYISFLHSVELVKKCATTGKWMVTVRGGQGCQGITRCSDVAADPTIEPRTIAFDGIAVCTGIHTWASLPTFPGQDVFKGSIVHSTAYPGPDKYAGLRVLVVGAGESGSDIANDISKKAAKVAIAVRGTHGHLVPRIQKNNRVTDLNITRCTYSNPYILHSYIAYFKLHVTRFLASSPLLTPNPDLRKILLKMVELNLLQGTSSFSKFGCKNEGFVSAMVLRGAELHRDSFELREDRAVFGDGSEFECDAVVACTGYRNTLPLFDKFHPEISHTGLNPRLNYRQVFCVDHPGEIGFFGYARPAFGANPAASELQARYFALVVSGLVTLPSQEEMRRVAEEDQKDWERRFGHDAQRVKGLVDFQVYCDGIARAIGVLPPLGRLFFSRPWLWAKVLFGPLTIHQYRLVGPGADPARAEEVYRRQSYGDLLDAAISASFLFAAKLLSLLGLSQYTPNSF